MEARYNIYFAGQLLAGHDVAEVRARMAKLFNADEATLDKLFSGKNQLLKRDCDQATARKYKEALEGAGAVPVIKAIAAQTPAQADAASAKPMTAAEKIAALAAASDRGQPESSPPPAVSATPAEAEQVSGNIRLAPKGTAVLLPQERQAPAASAVQVPDLDIDPSGQRLSEPPPPAPPPPDTSHLQEGPVGELIPGLPSSITPLSPDTSALELSPDGTDLSDCAAPPAPAPDLDLSGIDLAPAGADVLEPQYRKRHDAPAPATDHLTLEQ